MMGEHQSGFSLGRLQRPAFYLAVVGALVFFLVMLREMLPVVVTGWYTDLGILRVHDLNFFAMLWIALIGLGTQPYAPADRVTALVLPVLVMAPLAVLAVTTGSSIAMLPIIFTVVGLVVVALHPARRSLLRLDRVENIDSRVIGLLVVGAVPLLAYAADQLVLQYSVADEHAELVHYGGMAVLAVLILVLGLLAAVRRRDWRFAAWGAGVLAVYLGASSVAFPGYAGSVGQMWGGLAVVWGVVFVGAVEYSRRSAGTGAQGGDMDGLQPG